MLPSGAQLRWRVAISSLVAVLLNIFPLTATLSLWRPEWLLCVILSWVLILPSQYSVGFIFLSGLLMDLLLGTPLGSTALCYVLVAYALISLRRHYLMYSSLQKLLVLLLLFSLSIFVKQWVGGLVGVPQSGSAWLPLLSNLIVFPWIFILIQHWLVASSYTVKRRL